jgi:thioredoxin 1
MTFDQTLAAHPVVVAYFSTPACSACRVLRPKVEATVRKHPGCAFIYVDCAAQPEIAGRWTVFAVPTIMLFAEGRELRRFGRTLALQDLEDALARVLSLLG